jgi:hypothetical protein
MMARSSPHSLSPLHVGQTCFCSSSLNDLTQWHVYGLMVYGYLAGSPEKWPASLAKRLEARMARCQRVAFFCHTSAHWTLAVAEPATRLVRTFDSLAGGAAGKIVGSALTSFFARHLPAPPLLGTIGRPWRHHAEACALQPNNFDCGPHTIVNLLRAVVFHRDTQWHTGPDIPVFRRRVAAMLLLPVEDVTWCARD